VNYWLSKGFIVEKSHPNPDLSTPQPKRKVLGAVRHEQTHTVPLDQPLPGWKKVTTLIAKKLHRLKRYLTVFENKCNLIGVDPGVRLIPNCNDVTWCGKIPEKRSVKKCKNQIQRTSQKTKLKSYLGTVDKTSYFLSKVVAFS
jgi:hypothetical protein